MKTNKINTFSFIILIFLTIGIFFLDRNLAPASESRSLIVLLSNLKFALIYFFFMGIFQAHIFWKLLGFFIILLQVVFGMALS